MNNDCNIVQVGNLVDDTNIGFKNPERGRVYSIEGISPALNCCQGGGLQPKVIVYEESKCSESPEREDG